MKPRVNRVRPFRIPLIWDRNGDKKLIGYFWPGLGIIASAKGSMSVPYRQNTSGKGTDNKNKMHNRRIEAAGAEDYTYYGK